MTIRHPVPQLVSVNRDISTEEKVRFLACPAAYVPCPAEVLVEETHMSWVFLAGERVYKLKKPVRHPFLDFSTLGARERDCREEVRLNRRLAPDVYLGVMPLVAGEGGRLAIGGEGQVMDWLVVMRRLPAGRLLDKAIEAHAVSLGEIGAVTARLAAFYVQAEGAGLSPSAYVALFEEEHARNKAVLTDRAFDLNGIRVEEILGRVDGVLAGRREILMERIAEGRIVEGHGDLRPEHVCLVDPPVIIDCLEFNRRLRLVDPVDELTYLGLECARLSAGWIGPVILDGYMRRLGDRPPAMLISFYWTYRACLRARLSLMHIIERDRRKPGKWLPLARQYMWLAESAGPCSVIPEAR